MPVLGENDFARDVYIRFGVRFPDLRRFIDALQLLSGWRLRGGYIYIMHAGEEAAFIALRRRAKRQAQ